MSLSISVDVVESVDGTIDQAASLAAARVAISKLAVQHETETQSLGEAVSAVFDKFRGETIKMPALTALTCQVMNAQPENFVYLSTRVAAFVRANAGEGKLYKIAKGKHGGASRWADVKLLVSLSETN